MSVPFMPITLFIHELLFVRVGIFLTVWKPMTVEARVLEGAVTTTHVEVLARDVCDGFLVLINKFILYVTFINHPGWRNHQVTILSTNRASSVVSLFDLLVICGSPVSDAIEAKSMATILQYTEALAISQYFLQADDAFLIAFIGYFAIGYYFLRDKGRQRLRVHVLAGVSIPAVALLVILTNDLIRVVVQEVVNDIVIINQVVISWPRVIIWQF
jgi:hypothetical protein